MTSPAIPANDETPDECVVDARDYQSLAIVLQERSCFVEPAGKTRRPAFA